MTDFCSRRVAWSILAVTLHCCYRYGYPVIFDQVSWLRAGDVMLKLRYMPRKDLIEWRGFLSLDTIESIYGIHSEIGVSCPFHPL